jgi:hypothetical protein
MGLLVLNRSSTRPSLRRAEMTQSIDRTALIAFKNKAEVRHLERLSHPASAHRRQNSEYLRKQASISSNPKGWQKVAGGRGGKGARPPGLGAQVRCTPAGVPEPLSPHRTDIFLAPLRGAERQIDGFRWSCPFAPERPPATFCQPFGLQQRGACSRAGSKVDAHALKHGSEHALNVSCRFESNSGDARAFRCR